MSKMVFADLLFAAAATIIIVMTTPWKLGLIAIVAVAALTSSVLSLRQDNRRMRQTILNRYRQESEPHLRQAQADLNIHEPPERRQ